MGATSHQHKNAKPGQPSSPTSSPGDSPVEMTPLEASPENATWKDRTERNLHSEDEAEKEDALLDQASDLSFPASDPIAVSSISRIEKKPKSGNRPGKAKA